MSFWWRTAHTPLSEAAGALLEDVAAAFANLSIEHPGWPDPHRGDMPGEEEYERCLDPGRFDIVADRAQAWGQVLVKRGWATATTNPKTGAVTLHPVRVSHGAQPLRLDPGHQIFDTGRSYCVDLWVGAPGIWLGDVPDCACDACDSGSDPLLERLGQALFSVVDGSLVAEVQPKRLRVETSFGATERPLWPTGPAMALGRMTAAPWAVDWQPNRTGPGRT